MKLNMQKIKGKMKEKSITTQEMSDYIGITIQSFSGKINGRTDFRHSELTKLFTKLELSKEEISYFFDN